VDGEKIVLLHPSVYDKAALTKNWRSSTDENNNIAETLTHKSIQ
jgi:hypothetical protein